MAYAREIREAAVDAVRRGNSYREVAEALEISHETIARWVRQAGGRIQDANPAAVAPPAPIASSADRDNEDSEPELPPDADELTINVHMRERMLRRAREAERVGNTQAATRYAKEAAGLSNLIARQRQNARADEGTLRVSLAEINDAMREVEARVRALGARPILCSKCGRALSLAHGEGRDE